MPRPPDNDRKSLDRDGFFPLLLRYNISLNLRNFLFMKDETAALLSGLCLIHCIATPLLVALGGLGLIGNLLASEWIHSALILPIAILALTSLPSGWKLHRRSYPALTGLLGLSLLIAALFAPHESEAALSVSGGLLLIGAHLSNRLHCRQLLKNHNTASQ